MTVPTRVIVVLGTKKGVFLLESTAERRDWSLRGPFCDTWPINHAIADVATGTLYAAGGNAWFGAAVWKSTDLGVSWTHSSEGIEYAAGEAPVASAWSLAVRGDTLFVGTEPAGLFRSDDAGATWHHVEGLRAHPSRENWQPGGAGLIAHALVLHPQDGEQLWVGISAAGVFHTSDGGTTWAPRNRGTRADFLPEEMRYPEYGQCVHGIAMAADVPDRLYQQNHCGMYRSDDGGAQWQSIETGLPSSFGFPVATHPRDPDTVFLVPLNGDVEGRYMPDANAAAWRSRDGGESWVQLRDGLPQGSAYFNVLRQALATDPLSPVGVYFGTSSGAVFASADEGDRWTCIAEHLPTIHSVETLVLDA